MACVQLLRCVQIWAGLLSGGPQEGVRLSPVIVFLWVWTWEGVSLKPAAVYKWFNNAGALTLFLSLGTLPPEARLRQSKSLHVRKEKTDRHLLHMIYSPSNMALHHTDATIQTNVLIYSFWGPWEHASIPQVTWDAAGRCLRALKTWYFVKIK